MAINLKLQLASGQSLKDAPLELLLNGAPIARASVDPVSYTHLTLPTKA